MNIVDIIIKKRDGGKLTEEEIRYFVEEYTAGNIPDYQASALLMAIYFQKMDKDETFVLADAMKRSGDMIDLSEIPGVKVDKHSTGGVGDKTTLIVGPLAAACGVPIAKMSGRGLGFTGGTIDKLEAIPGFRTTLEPEEFLNQVKTLGISLIGQTAHITPADKKIYALRDVTGTVENLSLISASIMSKKLAAGSDAIVLDVKCGEGAFMKSFEDAVALGKTMCEIGNSAGKKTVAVVTDMNQPLGNAVGNSLEVIEAIETLKGNGPRDITELSIKLASVMVYVGGMGSTMEECETKVTEALESGKALEILGKLIKAQGGDERVIDDYSLFPEANIEVEIKMPFDEPMIISDIDAEEIGRASQHAGAGRASKEDEIDLAAGIVLHKKVGDFVKEGESLATIYGNDSTKVKNAVEIALSAYRFTNADEKVEPKDLIKQIIE